MKFLLDENFPKSAVELINKRGHESYDPRGTELKGCNDIVLVEEARRRGAIILTTDRDFFHTLRHQFPDHSGLIVIALKKPNRTAILKKFEWLLDNVDAENFAGRAFHLRDKSWVAAPPLPETP